MGPGESQNQLSCFSKKAAIVKHKRGGGNYISVQFYVQNQADNQIWSSDQNLPKTFILE